MPVSEQEFMELQGVVIKLKDELAAAVAVQNQLLSNGASDLLTGHGFQRYADGTMRIGRGGIQIEADQSGGATGMWYVPVLVPDPNNDSVNNNKAYIVGTARQTGVTSLALTAVDLDPPNAPVTAGDIELHAPGTADYGRVVLRARVDDSLVGGQEWGEVWLNRVFGEAAATLQLYQTILRLVPSQAANFPFTSDPANAIEGDIWYNTTDNQFKGVDASATKAFLMEGDVVGQSVKVKEADETVTTSTTLQDDNELLFAVAANEVWQFEGVLLVDAPAAADFKMTFTAPAGAVGSFGATYGNGETETTDVMSAALGTSVDLLSAQIGRIVHFWGGIHNGANAGSLTLQWAQVASSDTNTVRAGSYIKYVLANV